MKLHIKFEFVIKVMDLEVIFKQMCVFMYKYKKVFKNTKSHR